MSDATWVRSLTRVAEDLSVIARRLADRGNQAPYGGPGPYNQVAAVADPGLRTGPALFSLGLTPRVVVGLVTDIAPPAGVYRVAFDHLRQPLPAVLGLGGTWSISSMRPLATLQPGTQVVCMLSEVMPYAVILAAIPFPSIGAREQMASTLLQTNRQRVDEAQQAPLRNQRIIPDMLAGRPFDAVGHGEQGWIAHTGARIYGDAYLTMLGMDEACHVAAFYEDQLLRLMGHNLRIWSACRETESLHDEGETTEFTGWAAYPWEQLGLATPGGDPTRLLGAEDWQRKEPWNGKAEPLDPYTMPIHREREFHGYLGQGGSRFVQAAPQDLGSRQVCYVGGAGASAALHPGLAADISLLDGRRMISSVAGVSIVKRAAVISPVRLRPPDDPSGGPGDDATNYKFSGQDGEGPAHPISGGPSLPSSKAQLGMAMGVLDLHAYIGNYAGVHPFVHHSKDYRVPEPSELDYLSGAATPAFGSLTSKMLLDPTTDAFELSIDHRYGLRRYYRHGSSLDLLDDGSVALLGGMSAAIQLVGGSLILTAPGDIWLRSGRNVNIWAGWDAVLRAKNSADITVTEKDLRATCGGNMQLMAGNTGQGGVLIEGRGAGPVYDFEEPGEKVKSCGVMLRSTEAPVAVWAQSVYMRTGGGDITAGPIHIDADRGDGQLVITTAAEHVITKQGVLYYFDPDRDAGPQGPSAYVGPQGAGFPGSVLIDGSVIAAGSGIFDGSVLATGGMVAVTNPFVAPLDGDALREVRDAIANVKDVLREQIPEAGRTLHTSLLVTMFYDDQRPGNDDVIRKATTGLRSRDDYRTRDFYVPEAPWQQLARATGGGTPWRERPVMAGDKETYPYPGKEAWQQGLVTQDLVLYSPTEGRDSDRGSSSELASKYQSPAYGSQSTGDLDQYLVIR